AHRAAALRAGREIGPRDVHTAIRIAVPHGDAVPPPELSGDRPVPDVLHPVVVGLGPGARDDLDPARLDRLDRRLREWLGPHVPLLRDERFDHGLAAVADADRVAVGLDALDEPQHLHVLDDPAAALEAIEARVLAGQLRHLAVEADDRPHGQPVASADLEVDRVVARGDLDDAGAELRVGRAV